MLVVITILAILAYLVMADYNGEIKRSRVRVAAETVYGELQDLEMMVSSGSYDTDGSQMYCWGLAMSESGLDRIYTVYNDGCDYSAYEVADSVDLGVGTEVEFSDGFTGGYLFFDPPYADIKILDDDFHEIENLYKLTITLAGDVSSRYVVLDLLNGNYLITDEITE